MPKPSVGRIVHFKSYGAPDASEHRAAIITRVGDDDGTVDLCVLSPNAIIFRLDVNQGEREGQWHWPERDDE